MNAQVSTDGATWQTVGAAVARYDASTGWKQHEIALTGFTGSASAVQVGLLATSAYGNNIAVDEVELLLGAAPPWRWPTPRPSSATPVAGSMVAGFVTDANTTNGITGAKVVRDLGGLATTMSATGNLPDGFYYMFSAVPTPAINGPSTRTFTASKDGYGPVAHAVNLIPDTVNRLDFALPAGVAQPGRLAVRHRRTPDPGRTARLGQDGRCSPSSTAAACRPRSSST